MEKDKMKYIFEKQKDGYFLKQDHIPSNKRGRGVCLKKIQMRTYYNPKLNLKNYEFKLLRFDDEEVMKDPDNVLIETEGLIPSPLTRGAGVCA